MGKKKKRSNSFDLPLYASTGGKVQGKYNDSYCQICMSMLLHASFQDLTAKQQILYVYMRSQNYGGHDKDSIAARNTHGKDCFIFNKSMWQDLFHLYEPGNQTAFYRDRDELILHGFIDCIEDGRNTRTKSVYRFSDRWQRYGKPDFKPLTNGFPVSLAKKLNKTL